jgi:hypothetical protein
MLEPLERETAPETDEEWRARERRTIEGEIAKLQERLRKLEETGR